jgi:hypothetical protein
LALWEYQAEAVEKPTVEAPSVLAGELGRREMPGLKKPRYDF